jgi:hypothetical protein
MQSASSTQNHEAPRVFPASRPQLSILHLLIWLTAMALLVMTQRSGFSSAYRLLPLSVDENWSTFVVASMLILGMLDDAVLGIGICGLANGVIRVTQKKQFFHHPGHWLLVVPGGVGLTWIALALLKNLGLALEGEQYAPQLAVEVHVPALLALAQMIIYGAAWKLCDAGRWWKLLFVALATRSLLELVSALFSILTMPYWRVHWFSWAPWQWTQNWLTDTSLILSLIPLGFMPVIAAFLVAALIRDRYANGRDWAHWVGVFVALWSTFWMLSGMVPRIQFAVQWFS